jgi:hypothetical protein
VRWKLWAEAFRAWFPIVISVCAISLTIFQAMPAGGTRVGFGPAIMSEVAFRDMGRGWRLAAKPGLPHARGRREPSR